VTSRERAWPTGRCEAMKWNTSGSSGTGTGTTVR
jgi:hypothetical protein